MWTQVIKFASYQIVLATLGVRGGVCINGKKDTFSENKI